MVLAQNSQQIIAIKTYQLISIAFKSATKSEAQTLSRSVSLERRISQSRVMNCPEWLSVNSSSRRFNDKVQETNHKNS
jgi:hypothetical protein